MTARRWVPVSGAWPGYEICLRTGIVRSVDRVLTDATGTTRQLKGVELVQCGARAGQRQVTLSQPGRRKAFAVSTLLTAARQAATDNGA